MEKISRKRATDPIQEQLREHKAQWNNKVSRIIDVLSEFHKSEAKGILKTKTGRLVKALRVFKAAINGWPIEQLGLEKGQITEPFSPIVEKLANDLPEYLFDESKISGPVGQLFDDARIIINEQNQYAQTFQEAKRQKEMMRVSASLIKESSNIFTRLLTYVTTPFMLGDGDRWARKAMLRGAASLYSDLGDVNDYILSREINSIPKAFFSMKNFMLVFQNDLIEPLVALNQKKLEKNQQPEETVQPTESPESPESPPPFSDDPRKTQFNQELNVVREKLNELQNRFNQIKPKLTGTEKEFEFNFNILNAGLEYLYQSTTEDTFTYDTAKRRLNEYLLSFDQIEGVVNELERRYREAAGDPELIKLAVPAISRWVNRKLLFLMDYNEKTLRKSTDENIRIARSELDQFMDLLQIRNVDIARLIEQLIDVANVYRNVLESMIKLGNLYNNRAKIKRLDARSKGKRWHGDLISETDIRRMQIMITQLDLTDKFKNEK